MGKPLQKKRPKVSATLKRARKKPPSTGAHAHALETEFVSLRRLAEEKAKQRVVVPALQGTLTVTSDCAGMGSDLLAFKMCGLLPRIKTATWSEFDAGKRKLYRAVCRELGHIAAPVSKDITRRTHSAAPGCDIYIAGYPCPSFSALGKRKGTGDSRADWAARAALHM